MQGVDILIEDIAFMIMMPSKYILLNFFVRYIMTY